MDLNELLYQHQLALIQAGDPLRGGTVAGQRVVHYADLLRQMRRDLGVHNYAAVPDND